MWVRRSAAIGLGLMLLLGGWSFVGAPAMARATPAGAGGIYSFKVMAVPDYHFSPDTLQDVAVNALVNVTFYDADSLAHTFTIWSREGVVIPVSTPPTQLAELMSENPPFLSIVLNGAGLENTTQFRTPPTPGWYEFICNESGHFQEGQFGFIAFGEDLPSNLSPPSRVGVGGLSLSPLDEATIGVLLVAFLAVAVVWARRRRARPMVVRGS
jgi:plastocyanin